MADNSGVTGPSAMPAKRKINTLLTAVKQKKTKAEGPSGKHRQFQTILTSVK